MTEAEEIRRRWRLHWEARANRYARERREAERAGNEELAAMYARQAMADMKAARGEDA